MQVKSTNKTFSPESFKKSILTLIGLNHLEDLHIVNPGFKEPFEIFM